MSRGNALIAAGIAVIAVAATGGLLLQADGGGEPVSYAPLEAVTAPDARQRVARVKRGSLRRFSQLNKQHGRLFADRGRRHAGAPSIRAVYDGSGRNGYARGVFDVAWRPGDIVAYGASFYLPSALFDSIDGQLALMRWDDFPRHPRDTVHGGLVVNGADRRAYVVAEELGGDGGQTQLIGPVDLPRDRWFDVEVRQLLGAREGLTELRVDGVEAGRSAEPTMTSNRRVQRVRYGIVAIDAGTQRRPLRLWFDRATAARGPR